MLRAIPATLDPPTRAQITVLVEDELTSDLLTELFSDKRYEFRPAGGSWPLRGVLQPTSQVVPGAYGVLDRDFGDDNHAAWGDLTQKGLRIFKLPVHEAENLLLDFKILADLSGIESEENVRNLAEQRAKALVYWLACKALVNAIQREVGQGFPSASPPEPPSGINSLAEAVKHIYDDAGYWANEPQVIARWSRPAIEQALVAQERQYQEDITSGRWRETFSGKEIIRHLRSSVRNLNRGQDLNARQRDVDLAIRVSQKMRESPERIPLCLKDLYSALCARTGLPPRKIA